MKIDVVNIRVLTPSEGMWLYNSKDRVISDKVYLGVNATETDWVEITEETKTELETAWEAESNPDNAATE